MIRNLLCVLPDGHIVVGIYCPHPCGGVYCVESWCYRPRGRVGWHATVGHIGRYVEDES